MSRERLKFSYAVSAAASLLQLACGSADDIGADDGASSDGMVELCDAVELSIDADSSEIDVALRRPTVVAIPDVISTQAPAACSSCGWTPWITAPCTSASRRLLPPDASCSPALRRSIGLARRHEPHMRASWPGTRSLRRRSVSRWTARPSGSGGRPRRWIAVDRRRPTTPGALVAHRSGEAFQAFAEADLVSPIDPIPSSSAKRAQRPQEGRVRARPQAEAPRRARRTRPTAAIPAGVGGRVHHPIPASWRRAST